MMPPAPTVYPSPIFGPDSRDGFAEPRCTGWLTRNGAVYPDLSGRTFERRNSLAVDWQIHNILLSEKSHSFCEIRFHVTAIATGCSDVIGMASTIEGV